MILVGDIGGTRMRVAASDSPDVLEDPLVALTPSNFAAAVTQFTEMAQQVSLGRTITAAVVGVPGLLSTDRTTLLRAPHLRGWEGQNVAEVFGKAIGAHVRFENDVALGALGESRYGAGFGARILAYVSAGTGVNGALVVDGKLDPTAYGFEVGHQLLGTEPNAPEWESLVSGSGLEKRYGKPSAQLSDPAVWEKCADDFARGLYNILLQWSPERVVLGGTLFTSKSISIERVQKTLESINTALPSLPEIRSAALGDRSGLYGALALSY